MHGQSICCISAADVKSSPQMTPFTPDLDGIQVGSIPAFTVMPTLPSTPSRPSTPTTFSPKRLLTRALMAAALIGGAGAALSAGSAEAATGCGVQISWANWVGGQALTCGDKTFTFGSTSIVGDLASSLVSADEPLPGDHLFNVDWGNFVSNPFDFTYIATITNPSRVFSAVDLDSNADVLADPPSILTATYTFAGGNSPIPLTSTNGSIDLASVIGGPTAITVRNQFDGNGAIDSFQNSFKQTSTVPGPVPILGAGVAFGFSRRLRRRIDGARVKA